jgi:hypothetical protein
MFLCPERMGLTVDAEDEMLVFYSGLRLAQTMR